MKQGREVEPMEDAATIVAEGRRLFAPWESATSQDDSIRAAEDILAWATLDRLDVILTHLSRLHRAEKDRDAKAEALRDAVIAAFKAGATAVHEHHGVPDDPDFAEAAHDYAAQALTTPPTEEESA